MSSVPSRIRFWFAAILLPLTVVASAGELRFVKEPIQGQYIVVLKESAAAMTSEAPSMKSPRLVRPEIAAVARDMAQSYGVGVMRSYGSALRGFSVHYASDRALARLIADPRVAYVEENGRVYADATVGTQTSATWGLDRIDQRTLPLNGTYAYDTTAATVHAYIIDTGIFPANNDFGGRVSGGFTAINDGKGTGDCNSHGTHVAGTVGGTTWGVAKKVMLHPVRVLGCNGLGTYEDVIAGIDWVTANHVNPAVVNMSLGGGASQALNDAVTRLINAGVVTVVAAGNSTSDACQSSPSSTPSALTVGATTIADARASFSNFGKCVDLFAPGVDIKSAGNTTATSTLTLSGTSMASPHVAGAAALYLALNPGATPAETSNAIIKSSSVGRVTDTVGSPNLLLFAKGFNSVVDGPVFMDFTATSSGLITRFVDRSFSNSGAIASRSWTFGDGGTSTAAGPVHVYPRSGTYSVSETVMDIAGYSETKIKSVTVH